MYWEPGLASGRLVGSGGDSWLLSLLTSHKTTQIQRKPRLMKKIIQIALKSTCVLNAFSPRGDTARNGNFTFPEGRRNGAIKALYTEL